MATNYFICAVHYQTVGGERQITKVKTTLYIGTEIGASSEKAKAAVIADIESGRQVKTKIKIGKKWEEDKDVLVYTNDTGMKYIGTSGNDGLVDYLGDLPEY